jgi:D-hydroxyproline dehydrogenase
MKTQSIAVIGAGIVGICCALALQKRGARVTLFDRKGIAAECSKGNAGHFATEQVFPLANKNLLFKLPGMVLNPAGPLKIHLPYMLSAMPWFVRFLGNMSTHRFTRNTEALRALNHSALAAYEILLEEASLSHMLVKQGSLLTFETTPAATIKAQLETFKQQEVAVRWLNREQTIEMEPALSERISSALFFEDVAHTFDPYELCVSLARYFMEQGGTIVREEVAALYPHAGGVKVRQQSELFDYDKALICAGAWSKRLISPLGYRLPLDTERGYHLMLPITNPIQRPVASAERSFIMTPMREGLRLAGTVEFAGLKRKMNTARADRLLPNARKILQRLPESVEEDWPRWMGMRPSLPDSLPVMGKAPRHQHLYFAFGHQHLGLTQGAITGQLMAQVLNNEHPNIDMQPYCISRFN